MRACHHSVGTVMGPREPPGGRGCACILCFAKSASLFDCTLNITEVKHSASEKKKVLCIGYVTTVEPCTILFTIF